MHWRDDSALAVSDEEKKIARKSYHENLLNTEFAWYRDGLSEVDTFSSVACLTNKDNAGEFISKMKN